jgi:hypothetical protein
MSRLEIPLLDKTVWTTGDILLRAELDLLIRDNSGLLKRETFRVDSGTEMTTMPAARGKALNLPMPRQPVFVDINGVKHEVRRGIIRAQVNGMDPTEHVFPCYFLGDPDAPVDPQNLPMLPRNLLGLTGVVDKIRITFDGKPSSAARYGMLVVEKI